MRSPIKVLAHINRTPISRTLMLTIVLFFALLMLLFIFALYSNHKIDLLKREQAEIADRNLKQSSDIASERLHLENDKSVLEASVGVADQAVAALQPSETTRKEALRKDLEERRRNLDLINKNLEALDVKQSRMNQRDHFMNNEIERELERLGSISQGFRFAGLGITAIVGAGLLLGYLTPTSEPSESRGRDSAYDIGIKQSAEPEERENGEEFIPVQQGHQAVPKVQINESNENTIGLLFDTTQERLHHELLDLGRRSNVNLVTGVSITVVATAVLIYMVTRPHDEFKSVASVLSFYIPRVTTIALIEVFAYFFLGLYKSNLAEIKFYQNERTTIVALEIAWRASMQPEINTSTQSVISQLAKTDRNASTKTGIESASSSDGDVMEIVKSLTKIATDALQSKAKG